MTDERTTARTSRRRLLRGVAVSGALAFGGVGTVAGQPGSGRGPPSDGNQGNGGGNGGNRPPGSGPTRETGGSGLLVRSLDEGTVTQEDLPDKGTEFSFVEGADPDDEIAWYSGCDSVGSRARANTYQAYSVEGLTVGGESVEQIYVVDKRPVQLGDYLVAEASFCGSNTLDDEISDTRYVNGHVYKFGWEPGEEVDHEG